MKALLILGAGEFGAVTKEIAEAMGCYEKIAFLDDAEPAAIGKLESYPAWKEEYTDAIVAIDDLKIRTTYFEKLKAAGYTIPTLIHPTAFVAPSAIVGEGTIVEPMALLHTCTVIGRGCLISEASVVGHHTELGDFCYVASHATVMQNTYMKSGTGTITGQLFFAEPGKRTVTPTHSDYSFDSGM